MKSIYQIMHLSHTRIQDNLLLNYIVDNVENLDWSIMYDTYTSNVCDYIPETNNKFFFGIGVKHDDYIQIIFNEKLNKIEKTVRKKLNVEKEDIEYLTELIKQKQYNEYMQTQSKG